MDELQKIAQDLGAKHFRGTCKEQKTSFSSNTIKAKRKVKHPFSFDAEHALSSTSISAVKVAAEMDCPGHAPILPQLRYLQKEHSIQNLIALRIDKDSPISHQKYTLQLSNFPVSRKRTP